MKDYLGNELAVGDRVLAVEHRYASMRHAVVTKLTACFIFVMYCDLNAAPMTQLGTKLDNSVKRNRTQVVKLSSLEKQS